ncbi:MAG TPA: HAMP domain-containing sensor histidine kinase [Acidimicrobiales bacterium]
MKRPRFLPRLGLRARITIAFAVGALLLSALLAASTWGFTRQNQLDQRSTSATTLAVANAENMAQGINAATPDLQELLQAQPRPTGAHPILLYEGDWYPADPSYGEDALPRELIEVVQGGDDARMRYTYDGEVYLAVGVKLDTDVDAAYFEVVSLEELEQTLETLGFSLIAAALVTTLCGAGLGWWAARRVLRPLNRVGAAAKDIARGDLATRVEASDDPDLAQLAESFNEMAAALEQRIERDTRFASNVSHELRSPLTTLSASITVLENHRDDMPERARAALDLMVADVNRFRQLIEDLLEISRFDAGVMHLDVYEVRVAELVMQAVGAATDADIPLDIDSELAGVVVEADKRRLMRVIANLIDNAAKYGGGATRVELRQVDDKVQIAVEDDGPGIPDEDRDRIFDRFSRGLSAADRRTSGGEGVGLGLSLVAEHIRLHKGRVFVEDRPDGRSGARFVVQLPAARGSASSNGNSAES